jgi:DNA-binding response OmpR family regulator
VGLPGKSGYEISHYLRGKRCCVPVILLDERFGVEERIKGLKSGVDYIIQKPFDPRELLACVDAMLQRVTDSTEEPYYGNTKLLLSAGKLVCGDKEVRLSAKEFEVMRLLLQAKDRLLSKEVILARVWGYDSNAVENHVEVYVGFLRKKLRSIGSNLEIKAVRRMGYTLEIREET